MPVPPLLAGLGRARRSYRADMKFPHVVYPLHPVVARVTARIAERTPRPARRLPGAHGRRRVPPAGAST